MADETHSTADAAELLKSLRLSEVRLRGVLDSISDGFYAVDRAWRITEFNPAAAAYFRLTRQQVVGRSLWDLIENGSDEFKALLRAAMDGAPMAVLETQSLLRPGRHVELRIAPTEEGLCVALTDITDRLQTRARLEQAVAERTAALSASEDRLRTILETTHLFAWLINTDGTVLDANASSLAAIEMRKDEIVGGKFWETPWFSTTSGAPELVQEAIDRVAQGETFAQHIILNLPTGVRSFDFTMRPVKDEGGFVVAIVPEANETTARVKAEDELRQAQKLEAVGQLTGGVAHDFNNLLMVISGGLNMLDRSPDEAKRAMLMSRMREAVERGANLTKQLLAFSRRHELNPEPISLPTYFTGLNDLLNRSLGVNVRVSIDVPSDVAPVFADPHGLQLALLNLAVNARDAMNDGGVVTIRARNGIAQDAGAACVRLSVSDTGMGMTPEVRARIFEPFFTTKDTGKGSGLGLAQVHGFAEQSGGHVEVDSIVGAGTTFTLILPRGELAVGDQAEREAPPSDPALPGVAGNALLVEDDDNVAALTEEMLCHLGWRVTRVASAEAALNTMECFAFDLVFSDVMMPGGKSGIELARALKAQTNAPPIVLASGYSESVRVAAEEEGVPLLPKPFDINALAAVLDTARM